MEAWVGRDAGVDGVVVVLVVLLLERELLALLLGSEASFFLYER